MTASSAPADQMGPIETATAWLVDWLACMTGSPAMAGPPLAPAKDDAPDGTEASLTAWPLFLVPERELRTAHRREPFRFRVRHLVVGAGPAEGANRLLDRALVAAIEAGEPVIEFSPLSDHAWLALGCRPRVALLVDVPTQIARPTPEVPIVREPLRMRLAPRTTADGEEA
ncbi:MAG: hypothetical protein ACRDSE_24770 [Pseudonocardiaceae bacterium]